MVFPLDSIFYKEFNVNSTFSPQYSVLKIKLHTWREQTRGGVKPIL